MKKTVFLVVIIVVIFITVFFAINLKNLNENQEENFMNQFYIKQIYYYSNANAISNTTNYQNPEWNLNIYQYTDIAIYIDRLFETSEQNYIKKIYLSDISSSFENENDIGIYYLNPTKFGTEEFDSEELIEDTLEYTIINADNIDNDIRIQYTNIF
jgi:hypothetical protein